MQPQDYNQKQEAYFSRARLDIIPLFPAHANSVLEIGCGNGATLRYLQGEGRCTTIDGIELTESVALEAKPYLNTMWIGDAEEIITTLEDERYDAILCLDVLEHLVDPWKFVAQLSRVLKTGGVIIASIPNLRTFKVIANLTFFGRFTYADQGIMDRTHLRFFTKKSALHLLETKTLTVDNWNHSPFAPWSKSAIVNALSVGLVRDFLTEQYLVRALKK